jgi:hypothetical protein
MAKHSTIARLHSTPAPEPARVKLENFSNSQEQQMDRYRAIFLGLVPDRRVAGRFRLASRDEPPLGCAPAIMTEISVSAAPDQASRFAELRERQRAERMFQRLAAHRMLPECTGRPTRAR